MVLGLGSRSKKEKASVAMELAKLEVHLHEIRPWKRSYYQSSSKFMVLRWSRGDKFLGSSKSLPINLTPEPTKGESIGLDESFHVSFAPNLDVLKRAKKALRDQELDRPLVFNLFDGDNTKHPVAQTTLDMVSLTSVTDRKDLAIPFAFSKHVAKGSVAYLYLSVVIRSVGSDSENAHSGSGEVRMSFSDKSPSPIMPLDPATQRALVAALLSDEDDNEGEKQEGDIEIDAFTDDEDESDKKIKNPISYHNTENVEYKASWASSTAQTKQMIQSTAERQPVEPQAANTSIPRALSSTKAAAIAAATAYSSKNAFVSRKSFIDEFYESDPDSAGEDDAFGHGPLEAQSRQKATVGSNGKAYDISASIAKQKSLMDSAVIYEKKTMSAEKMVKMEDVSTRYVTTQEGSNASIIAKQSSDGSLESRTVSKGGISDKFLKKDSPKHETKESQVGSSSQTYMVEDRLQKKNVSVSRTNGASRPIPKPRDAEEAKTQVSRSPGQDSKVFSNTNKEVKGKASRNPEISYERDRMDRRIQHSPVESEYLKGELSDVATTEAAVYSATAEHSSSFFKLHTPARRLARTYEHTYKRCSQERRASCARNIMSGLILVVRACGNDVPRLTFWWSNTTVLREIISRAFNIFLPKADMSVLLKDSQMKKTQSGTLLVDANSRQSQHAMPITVNFEDWKDPMTFMAALERLEGWIYSKVVESIWWQVLTPRMQQQLGDNSYHIQNNGNGVSDPEEYRQGNISVDIWKKTFLEAYDRLCPVRRLNVKCGCLPMLAKMVLETCVSRLDVAMFNAILRDNEAPTDPISDPITDFRVLPISSRTLSFGTGAQLKNAVASLSGWLFTVIIKENDSATLSTLEEDEATRGMFPLLKALGGLLMLPKDMLVDESVRGEVCPALSLSHICKILSRFSPDELSPESVRPELLDTLSSEVEDANDFVFFAPSLIYSPPDSGIVRHLINDILGSNNKRMVKKGHTSDDEIDELESSISWLLDNTEGLTSRRHTKNSNMTSNERIANTIPINGKPNSRFQLLREVWIP